MVQQQDRFSGLAVADCRYASATVFTGIESEARHMLGFTEVHEQLGAYWTNPFEEQPNSDR